MNNICLWFEMSKLLAKYKYTYTCVTYLCSFFVHVSQSLTSNHVSIVTITCAPVLTHVIYVLNTWGDIYFATCKYINSIKTV